MPLFCREFNAKTSNEEIGKIVNVRIKVFEDKTFNFEVKGVPTSFLIKDLFKDKIDKDKKVISFLELDKISQIKLKDLNTENLENAKKTILGSIKSAGIKVEN